MTGSVLGRTDLSFEVVDDGYRILRNGKPASALSEGERNAVSLIHFLLSLEAHDIELSEAVVVIDDPVSSLDHNGIVGASALLWDRLVSLGCAQLILLTHTFELFRMWSYQLRLNRDRGRIDDFRLFEMRPRYPGAASGSALRQLDIVAWPDDKDLERRLRSEYHFLFWRVVGAWCEIRTRRASDPTADAEAAVLLPNACRRLLEAFLAFKDPENVGSLYKQLKRDNDDFSREERTRLRHFVDTYSHNESADASRPWSGPEAAANLDLIVRFIRSGDAEHFEAMCKALALDVDTSSELTATK